MCLFSFSNTFEREVRGEKKAPNMFQGICVEKMGLEPTTLRLRT